MIAVFCKSSLAMKSERKEGMVCRKAWLFIQDPGAKTGTPILL